jgi:serine O-acetyltransferase
MKKKIQRLIKTIYPFGYLDLKIIFWYRVGRYLFKKKFIRLSLICEYIITKRYNCAISCQAKIDKYVIFPHPIGIVIGGGCVIEENVTIYQNVTIGRKTKNDPSYPFIGEGTIIYSNSVVVGPIKIAPYTIIGANTMVNCDTETSCVYIGNPGRKLNKEKI